MVLWRLLCVIIVCALDPALDCLYTFYQPTRVLLNKTPTRLREHNCLAKDGPLHSYGGCDGVVVFFLHCGVWLGGLGRHGFGQPVGLDRQGEVCWRGRLACTVHVPCGAMCVHGARSVSS